MMRTDPGLITPLPTSLAEKRRPQFVGPLLLVVVVGVFFGTARSFISPALPAQPAGVDRQAVVAGLNAGGASYFVDRDSIGAPEAAGSSAIWAGALASAVGAAIALAGSRRAQKPGVELKARRAVALHAGTSALDQLRTMTTVVADTGVLEDIKKYRPQDATTNPTLVYKALSGPDAKTYFDRAITWAASSGHNVVSTNSDELVTDICDRLAVLIGCDILKVVPGLVSTEVDARLSYNTDAMVAKGRHLSKLYEEQGYGKDRILIKLASTWEAMAACNRLESEGIHTNMTLVLSLPQAVAAAEAGATLISPFVGRILDWYKKANNRDYTPEEDPGVISVREIFSYYKKFGYETTVMGASFRSAQEVLALSGCDKMTISPNLLEDLDKLHIQVQRKLDPKASQPDSIKHLEEGGLSEEGFRWHLNEDAMATELLGSGIRAFAVDGRKLEDLVRTRLAEHK
jgi:transaldolase